MVQPTVRGFTKRIVLACPQKRHKLSVSRISPPPPLRFPSKFVRSSNMYCGIFVQNFSAIRWELEKRSSNYWLVPRSDTTAAQETVCNIRSSRGEIPSQKYAEANGYQFYDLSNKNGVVGIKSWCTGSCVASRDTRRLCRFWGHASMCRCVHELSQHRRGRHTTPRLASRGS